MRITWTKISLLSLLAIALSLVLSFWLLFSNYSFANLLSNGINDAKSEPQSTEITDARLCLTNLEQQKYKLALANCQSAVKSDADNLETHLNLGLAYYHLADYQQAISQARFVIGQNPREYRAFYNWGLANSARGEYQQAIEQYQTALNFVAKKSKTERALIFNDLGAAWVMLKDYSKAIANLDRAVELDPSSFTSYFNRGCAHHRQGTYQKGIDDFTQVIALDASYTEAYISRAILSHLLRHEKAAYSDLDVALQQYQASGNSKAYQRTAELKHSMVTSKVHRTG